MANTIDNAYWILDELNARKNDKYFCVLKVQHRIQN